MGEPRYPAGWPEFSRRIRYEVAQGRCQCTGECGLHRTHPGPRRCVERDREAAQWAKGTVILTVAHLIAEAPIVEMLAAAERAQTVGPFLDPTLYREKRQALQEDIAMLDALRGVQVVIDRLRRRRAGA